MTTWASATAEQAIHMLIATGGLLRYLTPGAVDGFVLGASLSGLCLLVVVVPRIMHRPGRRAGQTWSRGNRHARVRPDYFAAPVDDAAFGPAQSARAGYRSRHRMTGWQQHAYRRVEHRHLAPRHAAPSPRRGRRMAGSLELAALGGRA